MLFFRSNIFFLSYISYYQYIMDIDIDEYYHLRLKDNNPKKKTKKHKHLDEYSNRCYFCKKKPPFRITYWIW